MDKVEGDKKVTDLAYLLDLAKGNQEFVHEMIKIFLEENPDEINMLGEGIHDKDFELVKASAHKLRSTVPFIGIDKIIETEIAETESLAGEIVQGKKSPTDETVIERINALFSKIKNTCSQACQELTVYNAV